MLGWKQSPTLRASPSSICHHVRQHSPHIGSTAQPIKKGLRHLFTFGGQFLSSKILLIASLMFSRLKSRLNEGGVEENVPAWAQPPLILSRCTHTCTHAHTHTLLESHNHRQSLRWPSPNLSASGNKRFITHQSIFFPLWDQDQPLASLLHTCISPLAVMHDKRAPSPAEFSCGLAAYDCVSPGLFSRGFPPPWDDMFSRLLPFRAFTVALVPFTFQSVQSYLQRGRHVRILFIKRWTKGSS